MSWLNLCISGIFRRKYRQKIKAVAQLWERDLQMITILNKSFKYIKQLYCLFLSLGFWVSFNVIVVKFKGTFSDSGIIFPWVSRKNRWQLVLLIKCSFQVNLYNKITCYLKRSFLNNFGDIFCRHFDEKMSTFHLL